MTTPRIVGISMESNVHFKLPVSFLIVKLVVEHGKCSTVIMIIQITVSCVQP